MKPILIERPQKNQEDQYEWRVGIDYYPAKKIIKYSSKFEIRDMGSGVILIKEPSVELMTDEDLADMGFGCWIKGDGVWKIE